eukprot:jgi/Ulvmu1/7416/UM036_0076.1
MLTFHCATCLPFGGAKHASCQHHAPCEPTQVPHTSSSCAWWPPSCQYRFLATVLFESLQLTHSGVGSIFHTGLFEPTPRELLITKPLKVESGSIPSELDGYYIRTGPNPQFSPIGGYHLFDGEAMIHCVQLKNGQATSYCNHWVRCLRFLKERKAGHNVYIRVCSLGDLLL